MEKDTLKRLLLLALCIALVPLVIEAGTLTEKSDSFKKTLVSYRGPYFDHHQITMVAPDADPSDDHFDVDLTEERWFALAGAGLQMLGVEPGTGTAAPTAAFNLQLHDANGFRLITSSEIITSAETAIPGNTTLGLQAPLQTSYIRISSDTDWGDTDDEITLHFYTFQRRY